MPSRLTPRRVNAVAAVAAVMLAIPAVAGAADREADQQIAGDSVLTIDDVPTGLEEIAASDEPTTQTGAACKAIRVAGQAASAAPNTEVAFRTAVDPTAEANITNQVSVFASTRKAKAAYGAYAASSAKRCFTSALERIVLDQLEDPSARVHVTVDRFAPELGDAAVGYDVVIALSTQRDAATLYADIQVVRVGRGLDAFGFFNQGSTPPSAGVDAMTRAGVSKLEAALATS